MTQTELQRAAEPEDFTAEERDLFKKLNIGGEGGVPMPSFIRPSEVRSRAAEFSRVIFESFGQLRQIWAGHYDPLTRRWQHIKGRKKRRELLQQAAEVTGKELQQQLAAMAGSGGWTMPDCHRPDIKLWRDLRETGSDKNLFASDPPDRNKFLWPHLNLEDLALTEPLPRMIGTRAQLWPASFASADLDRARFGMEALAIMPAYLNRYTMMFHQRCKAESYGELLAWEDMIEGSPEKFQFERRGIHPGEGLWLLEIQAVTYKLLVNVCKKLLHDLPDEELFSATPDDLPPPSKSAWRMTLRLNDRTLNVRRMQDENRRHKLLSALPADFPSLAAQATREPYNFPPQVNFVELEELLNGRVTEAWDHISSLREDPAYFKAHLDDWIEHRRERLPDANGLPHPILSQNLSAFKARVARRAIKNALMDVCEAESMRGKFTTLLGMVRDQAHAIDVDKDLPKALAFEFYSLDNHAENLKASCFGNISMGLAASPPMRDFFRLVTPQSADDKNLTVTAVDEQPADDETRRLIRCLGVLQDEKQRSVVGLPSALDELEYTLVAHPASRDRISPWVAKQISTLSSYAYVLRQIELFQPWAARFGADVQLKKTKDDLQADLQRTMAPFAALNAWELSPHLVTKAFPRPGVFDYPVDQGVDFQKGGADALEVAEKINQAEVALDDFWSGVTAEVRRTKAFRSMHLLSRPGLNDWTGMRRYGPEALKGAQGLPMMEEPPEFKPILPGKKFLLSKKHLKVVQALLYNPLRPGNARPAEMPWVDFLHAMVACKLDVRKLYGSAWMLSPRWCEWEYGARGPFGDNEAEDGANKPTESNGSKNGGDRDDSAGSKRASDGSGEGDGKTASTSDRSVYRVSQARNLIIHEPYTATNKLSPMQVRVLGRTLVRNFAWHKDQFGLKEAGS